MTRTSAGTILVSHGRPWSRGVDPAELSAIHENLSHQNYDGSAGRLCIPPVR
jgi:hypothetical protein